MLCYINLQHAQASTHYLCSQLAKLHTFIALIQEPWVHQKTIQGLPNIPNTNCFYYQQSCYTQSCSNCLLTNLC